MKKKFKPGDPQIYENIFDGLSFYQTTGEVYHTSRSKAKFHRFFNEALSGIKNPKVLDVGCFVGTELFMLPKVAGGKYIGIDVSKDAINYAKKLAQKRGESQIEFKAIDANKKLPFTANSFDVVYALELIEHLHDPGQFFDQVARVLKPNGRLIVSTPNGSSLPNVLTKFLPNYISQAVSTERDRDFDRHGESFQVDSSTWDHEAHISLFGSQKWTKIFRQHGFVVDHMEGSSIFGGSRFVSNRPFLLGLAIFADSLVDMLPLKPYLQMCLVASLRKSNVKDKNNI